MPRSQPNVKVQNNFVKGLITESTPLQFPEDACTETFNCIFDITGKVTRRLGIDAEDSFAFTSTTSISAEDAYTEFVWTSVGGNGSRIWLVQQQGKLLFFYDLSSGGSVSAHRLGFVIDLSDYLPTSSSANPSSSPCQYASGRGNLVVVNAATKPILLKYNVAFNDVDVSALDLRQRDFTGIDDGLGINFRPNTKPSALAGSNPKHLYNLINQGWYVGGGGGGLGDSGDILFQWDAARTDSPSNSDIPSLYRDTTTITSGQTPGLGDVFNPAYVDGISTGNTVAPKGHFIVDIFDVNRQQAMSNDGYSVTIAYGSEDFTVSRPSTVAFFVGRAFYAGVDAPGRNSNIYFTQIIERDEQYSQCHQKNDPTNEHFTDLLPDDGGVIRIPEIASVKRLFVFMNSLIILASNGVWLVSGSSQDSFQANDFQIRKISSIGTNSSLSVVDAKGVPFWWGEDGIYTLTFDPSFPNAFNVELITTTTVQTFFDNIPKESRDQVKGIFNLGDRTIIWLYNDTVSSASYVFNRALVYNTLTKAFYPWSIAPGSSGIDTYRLRGLFFRPNTQKVGYTISAEIPPDLAHAISFAESRNTDYKDWSLFNASTDFVSYFISGYMIEGETERFSQPGYVFVFLLDENNASCFVQAIFDFTNNPNTGKWSKKQQGYNSSLTERDVRIRKLKVRGKGRAIQLRFESESGKPFSIIGWSLWNFQNTIP